ncbi:hypothetical protein [Robinsoniella peoriensis]
MHVIEKIKSMECAIDDRYDISVKQVKEICSDSEGIYDICGNAFAFGYIQGVKATEEKAREKQINNLCNENKMNEEDYRYCIKKLADMIHDEDGLKWIYNAANRVFVNSEYTETVNPSK